MGEAREQSGGDMIITRETDRHPQNLYLGRSLVNRPVRGNRGLETGEACLRKGNSNILYNYSKIHRLKFGLM